MTIVRGRKRYTKDICFIDWLRHVAWARLYDHLRMHPLATHPETEQSDLEQTEREQSEHGTMHSAAGPAVTETAGTETAGTEAAATKAEAEHSNVVSLAKRRARPQRVPTPGDERCLLTTMQALPDEQCEIVLLRYCFKMDLNEIASFLDVARTSVSQLHRQAIVSLRRTLPEAV